MKIVHLTPYYAPAYAFGGVVRAVEALAQAQAARGHAVTVVTTDALSPAARIEGARDEVRDARRDGVRVLRVANASVWLRGRANLGTPLGLRAAMREAVVGAHVVHTHELRTLENLLALPIAARARVPIVLSPHGTLNPTTGRGALKRLWDRALTPYSARLVRAVAALTGAEAEDARALWGGLGLTPPHMAVIPNGVDTMSFAHLHGGAAFRTQWGIPPAARLILFLGRLHPRKGAQLLAEAVGRLSRADVWLVLAGPDEGGLALARAHLDASSSLNARTVVTGYLAGEARLAALAAADLFALPAVGEGLPMAALEALAAGVPVLVSPECHLPEVAEFGAGIIAAPEVGALTEALAQLLAADHAAMGRAARRLAHKCFDLPQTTALSEALYAELTLR